MGRNREIRKADGDGAMFNVSWFPRRKLEYFACFPADMDANALFWLAVSHHASTYSGYPSNAIASEDIDVAMKSTPVHDSAADWVP